MLEGVFWEPKKVIRDGQGAVLHHLRSDDPLFAGFGEIYCSAIPPGMVRAWKLHKKVCQRMIVPVGKVRFVLFDPRKGSSTLGQTQKIMLSREKHGLFGIPPGIWYGFEGLGPGESLIVNCANQPHDPQEVERLPLLNDVLPVKWPS
jgi:dTDP-4-dehydrorhamnose 3,5-epimerase